MPNLRTIYSRESPKIVIMAGMFYHFNRKTEDSFTVDGENFFTEVSDQAPPQFGYVISPLVTTSIEVGVFLTVAEAWKEIYAILDVSDATDAECHAIIAEIRAAMEKANEKPDVPLDRVVGMMKGVEGYGEEEASRD